MVSTVRQHDILNSTEMPIPELSDAHAIASSKYIVVTILERSACPIGSAGHTRDKYSYQSSLIGCPLRALRSSQRTSIQVFRPSRTEPTTAAIANSAIQTSSG